MRCLLFLQYAHQLDHEESDEAARGGVVFVSDDAAPPLPPVLPVVLPLLVVVLVVAAVAAAVDVALFGRSSRSALFYLN
jgi:hypothetical protein